MVNLSDTHRFISPDAHTQKQGWAYKHAIFVLGNELASVMDSEELSGKAGFQYECKNLPHEPRW